MAKSKPIGVRFDLDKLELIQKEQNLTSMQSVVNYLFDFYLAHSQSDKIIAEMDKIQTKRGAPFKNMPPYDENGANLADKPKKVEIPAKVVETSKNEPKEGSIAWFLKNG